jgi:hypothetical protein
MRFRYTLLPLRRRHGPWRETVNEARKDALEAGLARLDDKRPGVIWLDELVEVETKR